MAQVTGGCSQVGGGAGHPAAGLWFSRRGRRRPPWGCSQAGWHRSPWVGLWFSGGVVSSLWTWEPQRLEPCSAAVLRGLGLQQRHRVIKAPCSRACMFWGSERAAPYHQDPLGPCPRSSCRFCPDQELGVPQDHQLAPASHRPMLSSQEKPLLFLKGSQGSAPRAALLMAGNTAPRVQPAWVCTTQPVPENRLNSTAEQTRLPSRDANSKFLTAHFRCQKQQVTINTR